MSAFRVIISPIVFLGRRAPASRKSGHSIYVCSFRSFVSVAVSMIPIRLFLNRCVLVQAAKAAASQEEKAE